MHTKKAFYNQCIVTLLLTPKSKFHDDRCKGKAGVRLKHFS